MGKYSEILMDHFMSPRNNGPMESPDSIGLVGTPGNGPFLVLCVRVNDGVIKEAKYQTYGCGATIACGSMLTQMIVGRSIDECLKLTQDQLIKALDGIPPDKLHSPALAMGALQAALKRYGEVAFSQGNISQ
jgi:nitrogen fixation NifU-like protein